LGFPTGRLAPLSISSAPCQKPASNNLQKWFLSPTGRLNFDFITEGKLTAVLITPSSWGSQLVRQHRTINKFSGAVAGEKEDFCKGSLSLPILSKIQKIVPFIVGILLLYFWFIMLIPKYVLKDLSVGSSSIIGKDNIEEFFNHVSKHKDIEDRSLSELARCYEIAVVYLVHMLEARFVNLNPIMQQMFLKLHDIEDTEKRNFILETLRKESRDVVIEARKVFDHFNMLGSV
jgi:hypothetical protein